MLTIRGKLAIYALEVVVGLLLVSIAAPAPLTEERTHATLEVLLTTPLSTGAIIWGKWWGSFRSVLVLAVLPVATLGAIGWIREFGFRQAYGSGAGGKPLIGMLLLLGL